MYDWIRITEYVKRGIFHETIIQKNRILSDPMHCICLFLTSLLSDDLQRQWWQYLAVWGTDHSGNRSLGKYLLHPVSHSVSELLILSLRYTIYQTLLTLLICGLAGFAFEIYHDRKKDMLFKVVLFAMMISITPLMVPLFQMYTKLGIVDTIWGLMAPFLASPLIIMIFRQNSRGFPYELVEAARLDGVSELGIFFRIYLPCMKSTFSLRYDPSHFPNAWNSYQWAHLIMYDDQKIPMTVFLTLGLKGNSMTLVLLSHGSFSCCIFYFSEILCRRNERSFKISTQKLHTAIFRKN